MASGIKLTLAEHQSELQVYYGGHIQCLEYRGKGKLDSSYYCSSHERDFEVRADSMTPNTRKQGKRLGCPQCHASAMRKRYLTLPAAIQERLDQVFEGKVWVNPDTYVGQNHYAQFYCYDHDIYWTAKFSDVIKACGCPVCGVIASTKAAKRVPKKYKLGKRTVTVEGYEPQALDYIQQVLKYDSIRIAVQSEGSVPMLELSNGSRAFPDIYIQDEWRLVEVKSLWTLGLSFDKLVLTHAEANRLGYKYNLLLFCGNQLNSVVRQRLPDNWYQMTFQEVCSSLINY